MTGTGNRTAPALRNSRVMIPMIAGACLILLAVVLKNVLLVPAQQLSSDMLLYIIIYTGFIATFQFQDDPERISLARMALWIGTILLTTLGIIAVYAI